MMLRTCQSMRAGYERKAPISEELLDEMKYEFEMYEETLLRLLGAELQHRLDAACEDNRLPFNVLLESHLLHARNLIRFFAENNAGNGNDLSCEQIERGTCAWYTIRGREEKKTDWSVYDQICERLSHLSPKRTGYEKVTIAQCEQIAGVLLPLEKKFWQKFLNNQAGEFRAWVGRNRRWVQDNIESKERLIALLAPDIAE